MIGTNNIGQMKLKQCSGKEVTAGVETIITLLRDKLPETKILLLAIFPRADVPQERIDALNDANERLAHLDDGENIFFLNINRFFPE